MVRWTESSCALQVLAPTRLPPSHFPHLFLIFAPCACCALLSLLSPIGSLRLASETNWSLQTQAGVFGNQQRCGILCSKQSLCQRCLAIAFTAGSHASVHPYEREDSRMH
eukprot:2484888-Pleurochrysis_carterae.AAC.2